MAENSKIEWTTHTFNPWIGCTKVSEGCRHCYAEEIMDTRYGKVQWGPNGTRVRTSDANWRKPLKWNKDAKGMAERPRVFCASLADVFEDREELIPWREDLFALIDKTPNLDWLILTKRPQNVKRFLDDAETMPSHFWPGAAGNSVWDDIVAGNFDHVWFGTSVEDQVTADARIPELLKIPAAVRFLSMEPLLGPVDFREMDLAYGHFPQTDRQKAAGLSPCEKRVMNPLHLLNWVIVGGESGHHARPMHPEWVRDIREQCLPAGVPFFFKQWGEHNSDGTRVGKKAAGRLLDGTEWNEAPQ